MTIKFAGGFLPYFYKLDAEAFEGNQLGQQIGPFVKVKIESLTLLKHEEHHIKQFYLSMVIVVALLWMSTFSSMPWLLVPAAVIALHDYIPYVSFHKEAAAYAVSVSYGRELESAASALSRHRYANGDIELASAAISTNRYYNG